MEAAKRQLDEALRALSAHDSAVNPGATPGPRPPRGAPAPADAPDAVATLARLLAGAALLGMDELARRGPRWEQQARGDAAGPPPADPPLSPPAPQTAGDTLRLALTGWVFATQERLRAAPDAGSWLRVAASQTLDAAAAVTSESIAGLRQEPSHAGQVHSPDLSRWVARGQVEEERSRALARVALSDIAQSTITYLAHEPAVEELIQKQSTSLAGEALEEVRERAVNADIVVDRLVRRLLGGRAARSLGDELAARDTAGAEVQR
jgi:hypothetical protein